MRHQFSDCTFDSVRGELHRAGKAINLEPQALAVLSYLFEHRDRVVPYDELFEQCWTETYVGPTALTSALRRIRRALGQTRTGPTLIETRHRRGYRFVAEVTELAEPPLVMPENDQSPIPPLEVEAPVTQGGVAPEQAALALAPNSTRAPKPVASTERRHLTVLSCTLLDAQLLTEQLGPEDYYDLIQTFRTTSLAILTSYEGYEGQYVEGGMLVYFGYPQASEDDAQRAVRAGLALVKGLSQVVSTGFAGSQASLGVGVGIDSGMMIMSSGASPEAQKALAMGAPLTRAGRLSQSARPDTVVISAATAELLAGHFDCKALGESALNGQSELEEMYEVVGESALQTRLEVGMVRGLTPFVGREAELALLRERWTYVEEGQGQVVLLRGEAGIGKSRLLQALKTQVAEAGAHALECRCSPYHQHSSFYPIIDLLQRSLNMQSEGSEIDKLEALETSLRPYRFPLDECVPLLASLLSVPVPADRYPPLEMIAERQREQTLEVLSTLLLSRAAGEPVLFIIEDLHWADPSTLDFLEVLLGQVSTASMLVLLTSRPQFEVPWSDYSWIAPVTLNRLTRPQIYQMIQQASGGKGFSPDIMERLAEKTDGVPLFVEELTRAVLDSGQFEETEAGYELVGEVADLSIPATLHDLLMSRLDRLGEAKDIAQWGSGIGRDFSYELMELVTPYDETALQDGLDHLVRSELVLRRGLAMRAVYRFKHALVQDVAYESLRPRLRQEHHGQVAAVLAAHFPETVEVQPELLAYHYTKAGQDEHAVNYWLQAGQRALKNSANQEAVAHLRQGLELLTQVPDGTARVKQELAFQELLGMALIAIKGYGALEVEPVYLRARELCEQLGDVSRLIPVLRGLAVTYVSRGELGASSEIGEELLRLAQAQSDPELRLLAHQQMGLVYFYQGAPALARTHHQQVLSIFTPESSQGLVARYGTNFGAVCHIHMALELWQLGYPNQALHHSDVALGLGEAVLHPFSQAIAMCYASVLHQFRRDASAARTQAAAAITLATSKGFAFWVAQAMVIHGWSLSIEERGEAGITELRRGITAKLVTGSKIMQAYYLGLLASVCNDGGNVEEGLSLIEEALALIAITGVRFYEAELLRLKGELLLTQAISDTIQAEACLHEAIVVAQHQQAKSWELRAATSLARLWQSQDKRLEAYDLLSPIYEWFTEGFDTTDLQEAKVLLEGLG